MQRTHPDSKAFPDLSRRSDLFLSFAQPDDDNELECDDDDTIGTAVGEGGCPSRVDRTMLSVERRLSHILNTCR